MPGEPTTDPSTDQLDPIPQEVHTSIDLDVSPEDVMEALRDPELLSAWLGPWVDDGDGDGATVLTDDGRLRRVTDRRWSADGVRWRWHGPWGDDAPVGEGTSEVTIRVIEADGITRLTVHERQLRADTRGRVGAGRSSVAGESPVVVESAVWLARLLALGAVLSASSLVRV